MEYWKYHLSYATLRGKNDMRGVERMLGNDTVTLRPSCEVTGEAVADFYVRNQEFLEPFEARHEAEFYTAAYQQSVLDREVQDIQERKGYHFYIFENGEPDRIIGIIRISSIVWGAFRSCFMGYKMDKDYINRGYMTMAVFLVTRYAFTEVGLHRIEANVMLWNERSLRVLEKCGYQREGISRKYLKINGKWEDHVHMVKLNDDECVGRDWLEITDT